MTPAEYAVAPWAQGVYDIATESGGGQVPGWTCWPFAAHERPFGDLSDPEEWVLDHMPSGRAAAVLPSLAECQMVARALVMEAGGLEVWDFARPEFLDGPRRLQLLNILNAVIPSVAWPNVEEFPRAAELPARTAP